MKKKTENKNIKLTVKNVRCFSEEQHFDIRPLTFLAGENSTGKTTVMGCFSVIGNLINSRNFLNTSDSNRKPYFNRAPYLMGSFQDIVTKKQNAVSGKNGQKETFEIGCDIGAENCSYKIHFAEREKGADPVIQKAKIDFKGIVFSLDNKKLTVEAKDKSKNGKGSGISADFNRPYDYFHDHFIYNFIEDPYYALQYYALHYAVHARDFIENGEDKADQRRQREKIIKSMQKLLEDRDNEYKMRNIFCDNIVSLAPIRSKPKRTYDPIREDPDPEGAEIPVTLMKLSRVEKNWRQMHKKLIHFGKTAGLFSDITVKKYGESIGEPFQLRFQVRDFQSNIMDVGYGVSQILPLLARLFYPQKKELQRNELLFNHFRNRFLLQQPEAHLHPKAQAEFASLLVESIKENNSFLIETHSDYMIDRARIEIRKKNISPNDVSLIYLEPVKGGVKAHNLSFDKEGNLIGAPKGYRDFFIKETSRSLGFE